MNRKLHRATTGVAGAALAAIMALGVAGCSQPDDGPQSLDEVEASYEANNPDAASDEPTQSEADAAKQEKLASATERYKEYFKVRAEYAQRGENGFKPLLKKGFYGSQETMDREAAFWSTLTREKLKQKGTQQVVDAELVEFKGDPLASIAENRIVMDVCVDSSKVDVVRPDGASALNEPGARYLLRIEMQGQGREEGQEPWWSLANGKSENETKEKC